MIRQDDIYTPDERRNLRAEKNNVTQYLGRTVVPFVAAVSLYRDNLVGTISSRGVSPGDTITVLRLEAYINRRKSDMIIYSSYDLYHSPKRSDAVETYPDWLLKYRLNGVNHTDREARNLTILQLDAYYADFGIYVQHQEPSPRRLMLTIVTHMRLYLSSYMMNLDLPRIDVPHYTINTTTELFEYINLFETEVTVMYSTIRNYFSHPILAQVD